MLIIRQWVAHVNTGTAIAFVGWLVTGVGWYVSRRSQSQGFVNQVRNSARSEIASAVRTRQNALAASVAACTSLSVAYTHDPTATAWPEDKWREMFERFQQIRAGEDVQWVNVLEQYEVLFPETADCRRQLVERASALVGDLAVFSVHLLHKDARSGALSTADQLMERLMDEQALLQDLLVHIQNVTLGDIVGKTAPLRRPEDPTVARIVMQRNGQLAIVEGARA